MTVVQHLPESGHVVDGTVEIERIVLGLESQDLPHLTIGCYQVAFFVVEGQSGDRLLKDHTVLVSHLVLLAFQQHLIRLVGERAEDIGRHPSPFVGKLYNTDILDKSPVGLSVTSVKIPSEHTFLGMAILYQSL